MTDPELAVLDALPPSPRKKVKTLSVKLGRTHVEVLMAAVEAFYRIQEFADCCMDSKGKPENPRLVGLVPDPEHRRIHRAVQRAMARDSAKSVTKEEVRARGRAGGLARKARLSEQRRAEISAEALKQRWKKHYEKCNDVDQ